jgi:hypothetical protein
MKKKQRKAYKVSVTFTVTDPNAFSAVPDSTGKTYYTPCKVSLTPATGRVTWDPGAKAFSVHQSSKGPVEFAIRMGPKGAFFPAGVAFVPKRSPGAQRLLGLGAVRANFQAKPVVIENGVLTFTDDCVSNTFGKWFEFYLYFQRSDGKQGIIDPGIQHDAF